MEKLNDLNNSNSYDRIRNIRFKNKLMEKLIKKYKVIKDKCLGCGSCVLSCPEGLEMDIDGKALVISSAKVEECGGIDLCPYGSIEIENGEEPEEKD